MSSTTSQRGKVHPDVTDARHHAWYASRRAALRARKRRHLWRRSRPYLLGAGIALVVAVGGLSFWLATGVRADMATAAKALEQGRSAIGRGDPQSALQAFARAEDAFDAAAQRLGHPGARAVALVPGARQNVSAVRGLVAGGEHLAQAGAVLATGALGLPEGTDFLAPRDGVVPLGPLEEIAPAVREASDLASGGHAVADATTASMLVGPVRDARTLFLDQAQEASRLLSSAAELTELLPTFLGGDEPRRYLFAAQNPAELRGTGGFIGAYSVVTADEGQLTFQPFQSVIDVTPRALSGVDAPSADFSSRYGRFGASGMLQNANMTPDFPTAATALLNIYESAEGERLDGVIAADPSALQALLRVTGPMQVAGVGTVDRDNVVGLLAVEGYGVVDDARRKRVFGAVATAVLDQFLRESSDPASAAEALVEASSGGHMLFSSEDPAEQDRFGRLGLAGALPPPGGDFLAVVINNAGQNKLDYYTDRHVRYESWLQEDGSATGLVTTTLSSDAPTTGPLDVVGPNVADLEAGENLNYISVYSAPGATVERTTAADGRELDLTVEEELGRAVVTTWEPVAAGEDQTFSHIFKIPEAWLQSDGLGTYTLGWHHQPTARMTTTEFVVHLPPGSTLRDLSPQWQATGDEITWAGRSDRVPPLALTFTPPGRDRIWDRVVDFVQRPIWEEGG